MSSALIPEIDGGRVVAWTDGDAANGTTTRACSAEDAAIVHYERMGYSDPQIVNAVNSGGRGFVFRVWRSGNRAMAREVMR